MLRSFLVITLRILWRNKVTSFVNIASLGVGMTAFIFIMLYVQHELSFDKFHENYDRIYRLEGDDYSKLPPVFGYHLKERIPEIENVAFISQLWGNAPITYIPGSNPKERIVIRVNYGMSDSTTFDVLTFPMIKGDPRTALKHPMSIVLSETTARKLFGDDEPVGKTVISYNEEYHVTGVFKDVKQSHIDFDILVSASSFARLYPVRNINSTAANSWAWSVTYLLMNENVDPVAAEVKINSVLAEINNGVMVDTKFTQFHLRPIKDIYFGDEVQHLSYGNHGNIQTVIILVTIGFFLLALSGINYVNLTTARSTTRSKEIAIKRVTGSSVNLLRLQLMGESVIIAFISLTIALTIVQLVSPWFSQLTGVTIDAAALNAHNGWLKIVGGGLVVGIVAGVYPAFFLTAIQPLHLMKGEAVRNSRSFFRSVLMTFQFALSVIMIVAIVVIYRQLTFVQTADLGFNKQQIITVFTPADFPGEFSLRREFKARLQRIPGVEGIAFSSGNPGADVSVSPTIELNGERIVTKVLHVDENYLNVLGMTMVDGKPFSPGTLADSMTWISGRWGGSLIFNETARSQFSVSPGQRVYIPNPLDSLPASHMHYSEVSGIVKDFHYRSFHEKIEPLTFVLMSAPGPIANIRVSSNNLQETIRSIEAEFDEVWNKMEPCDPYFMDEVFGRQYNKDQQLAVVIGYFAMLAIAIACLGLFALSSFMVSRRVKEIGVRKTLGASERGIYVMLSWDFLKWILIAIVIACPISWFTMNTWLNTFAYHISIGPDVFIMAGLLTICVALLTITGQSLRVARANPVDSLRYE